MVTMTYSEIGSGRLGETRLSRPHSRLVPAPSVLYHVRPTETRIGVAVRERPGHSRPVLFRRSNKIQLSSGQYLCDLDQQGPKAPDPHALIRQYEALMATENINLTFADEAIREIARTATQVNDQTENIGARRLHTIMETLLEELSFEAPERNDKQLTIDAAFVRERLTDIAADVDLSRYIL